MKGFWEKVIIGLVSGSAVLFVVACYLTPVAILGGLIYVAVHFIHKFW